MKKALLLFIMIVLGALIVLSGCSKLSDHIFYVENPNLVPGESWKDLTISTLDGQSWDVISYSDLTLKKFAFSRYTEIEDEIELEIYLSKAVYYGLQSHIKYEFHIKAPKNPGEAYRANITYFRTEIKDNSFPIANYLFSLEKTTQRKEVIHIAQQVLEKALR